MKALVVVPGALLACAGRSYSMLLLLLAPRQHQWPSEAGRRLCRLWGLIAEEQGALDPALGSG